MTQDIVERLQGAVAYGYMPRLMREVATEAAATITELRAENARLREALEPSGDTKAAYMGEFTFRLFGIDENGDDYAEQVYVPWTTIKEIMAAILARATILKGQADAE